MKFPFETVPFLGDMLSFGVYNCDLYIFVALKPRTDGPKNILPKTHGRFFQCVTSACCPFPPVAPYSTRTVVSVAESVPGGIGGGILQEIVVWDPAAGGLRSKC